MQLTSRNAAVNGRHLSFFIKLLVNSICLLVITIGTAYSQSNKPLTLSAATGWLNSPYYTNAKAGFGMLNFGVTYHFSKKHALSADFLVGKHRYYDSIRSNVAIPLTTPGYANHTNSEAWYSVTALLYQFTPIETKRFRTSAATGFGLIIDRLTYPYGTATSQSMRVSASEDLCFPIRLSADYKLSNTVAMGLIAGLYIHPDYPVLAQHAGLRMSVSLK